MISSKSGKDKDRRDRKLTIYIGGNRFNSSAPTTLLKVLSV